MNRKSVKVGLILCLVVIIFFLLWKLVLGVVGRTSIMNGNISLNGSVCMLSRRNFDIEYSISIFSYDCKNPIGKIDDITYDELRSLIMEKDTPIIDSIISPTCAQIDIEKTQEGASISMKEDRLCSMFGPCTEGRKQNSCHWEDLQYSIDQSGHFQGPS